MRFTGMDNIEGIIWFLLAKLITGMWQNLNQTSRFDRKTILPLDTPSKRLIPHDANHWDLERKRDWIHKESYQFLCSSLATSPQVFTDQVFQLDQAFREGFKCRFSGCQSAFPLHSSRKRLFALKAQCSRINKQKNVKPFRLLII